MVGPQSRRKVWRRVSTREALWSLPPDPKASPDPSTVTRTTCLAFPPPHRREPPPSRAYRVRSSELGRQGHACVACPLLFLKTDSRAGPQSPEAHVRRTSRER